jgi:hypothetical protein
MKNNFLLSKNTKISFFGSVSTPITHTFDILFRDMEKVFDQSFKLELEVSKADIIVKYSDVNSCIYGKTEVFHIYFYENSTEERLIMVVEGSDELGIIYGILYISHQFLEVDPFWFWTDKSTQKRNTIEIPVKEYLSSTNRIRYRGWFVNDEVCLIGWTDVYPPPKEIWHPVFETLLRCGGNMVIPGTDLPRSGIHWDLALDMGLYITHHHAEPLGAEMFFRVYPECEASYDKNASLFEGLWREAIENQKDRKVVWVLGFRGQGDCPFWEHDPSYNTPELRGKLISKVICRQYEILCEYIENPPCSTYLYGEITELYREGYIELPEGVIKIWSDNGYGKMVSRRQGNHNLRVPSLPTSEETGPHGLYYHITFHDLQASNHLTMFPSEPNMIKSELVNAFESGADYYLALNCGNIRPHVYLLDIISQIWSTGEINIEQHLDEFCTEYFNSSKDKAKECYKEYFKSTIKYGPNDDDRAGDEFYHHPARLILGCWIRGEDASTETGLIWATGDISFYEQVRWFYDKLVSALPLWSKLQEKCEHVAEFLSGEEAVFFCDNLLFQVKLHLSGCKGFISLCEGYFSYCEKNYPLSFVYISQAIWDYYDSLKAMAESEHGRWENFYRADWLTNVKSTIYSLEAVRKFLRMHGDSPDFFLWYKEFIMPINEKKIYLENTHRKPLTDDELAKRLLEKFTVIDKDESVIMGQLV